MVQFDSSATSAPAGSSTRFSRTAPGDTRRGLSSTEARDRLLRYGHNVLPAGERRGPWRLLREVLTEPMFLLLVAAAGLYLLIGDPGEGLLLSMLACMTVALVVMQQRRSEHALEALRDLAAPQVRVLRDGIVMQMAADQIVPGDVFLLAEGDRIAADGVVREAPSTLRVDESLLTGEAMAVCKAPASWLTLPAPARPGGDGSPHVYAGTLVVAGHAVAEATATGSRTQAGLIGSALARIDQRPTPLQLRLRQLVRWLAAAALAVSVLLALWQGLRDGHWLEGALMAIAFAMAMLPEEIPMVLTVFLALGAWRMARLQVLARRPAVLEALGGATVLCVDKTGTLTENRLRLRKLVSGDVEVDLAEAGALPEAVHALLEYGVAASRRGGADPLDLALLARSEAALRGTEHLHPDWLLEHEYPLTPALLATTQTWIRPDGRREAAAKGAPEALADLCHLDATQAAALRRRVDELAQEGLRMIAVAHSSVGDGPLPSEQHDYDFRLLGLLAFEDPLRPEAAQAVSEARAAGLAVAMITGDHAATALAVARAAGIASDAGALTGEEIDRMDARALAAALRSVRVFARVLPEQKLRLVQAFQANGEVVAMTGDGVNDAPALKAADIGIAMGARGTDVAREAAGIVLLDENFSRVVAGVRMGRRVFDNLARAMTYITAIHVPVAGLTLLPVALGLPPVLLPAHVVLTHMVIDPACSFTFDAVPEDPELMRRAPRRYRDLLLGWPTLRAGLIQGGILLVAIAAVWLLARYGGAGTDEVRALAFCALTAGNLLLVWMNSQPAPGLRTTPAPALLVVVILAAMLLAAGMAWEPFRALLRFSLPSPSALLAAVASGCAAALIGVWAARTANSASTEATADAAP